MKFLPSIHPHFLSWLVLLASVAAHAQSPSLNERTTASPQATPNAIPGPANELGASNASWGTAFVVAPGYLVTANHVVQQRNRIRVGPIGAAGTGSKRWLVAEVVKTDAVNDLALLKVSETPPALKLNPSPSIPIGIEAYVIGYPQPRIQGASRKITGGVVNGYRNPSLNSPESGMLQISAEVSQGNSGGPVIAPDGTVIGMVQKKINTTKTSETSMQDILINVNYALRSSQIIEFLQSENIQLQTQLLRTDLPMRPYQIFENYQQSVLGVIGLGQNIPKSEKQETLKEIP